MRKEDFIGAMGEIDDKFYKEAEEYICPADTDAVSPLQVIPKKKSPARIAMPVVASVALVGVLGAAVYFGGGLGNINPNAEITTEAMTQEEKEAEYCINYVKREKTGEITRNGEAVPFDYRIMDLNFDGKEEILVTVSREVYKNLYCPIFIFSRADTNKSNPKFIQQIAGDEEHGYLDSLEDLYPYEEGEEKYWYYYFRFQYESFDTKGMGKIRYEEDETYFGQVIREGGYYMTLAMSYGVDTMNGSVFFRDYVEEPKSHYIDRPDISEEEFRALWEKHDKLPPISFWDADITSLSEYTPVNETELPDVHGDYLDIMNAAPQKLYPKIKLGEIGNEDRLVTLVGENARTDKSRDPDMVYCGNVYLVLSGKGKILSVKKPEILNLEIGGEYAINISVEQPLTLCFDTVNGKELIVFKYYYKNRGLHNPLPQENAFFAVKNDTLYQLRGNSDLSGQQSLGERAVILTGDYVKTEDGILDMGNMTEYVFDAEAMENADVSAACFSAKPLSFPDLSEYVPLSTVNVPEISDTYGKNDGETEKRIRESSIPKVLLAQKEIDGYTFSYIAENMYLDLESPLDSPLRFRNDKIVITENGGFVFAFSPSEQVYSGVPQDYNFEEVIDGKAFVLKDGIVVNSQLLSAALPSHQALFTVIKNGTAYPLYGDFSILDSMDPPKNEGDESLNPYESKISTDYENDALIWYRYRYCFDLTDLENTPNENHYYTVWNVKE